MVAQGERVSDEWLFLGQRVEVIERGHAQRTWLLGATTRRPALVVQFSIAGTPYPETFPSGRRQRAELVYWPGALPQRALIASRQGSASILQERLPGVESIAQFLDSVTAGVARQPWQERFLCVLRDAIPLYDRDSEQWWIRDSSGQALPLIGGDHWRLLSLSGGMPVDFAGEWNGELLVPLGVLADGTYYIF